MERVMFVIKVENVMISIKKLAKTNIVGTSYYKHSKRCINGGVMCSVLIMYFSKRNLLIFIFFFYFF